ncbi:benzoate/H(+) symporter BenE family transporter [Mycolicibacterium sp. 018/SC-01/001]|uniref:benzoate/H(+) symporter BenE family transporter n=1 Tax=Mycolicibacterium sp. 018/SC-01/001 TaxID=2592069 RepID=UPI00117BF8F4|nr:benzoate/H(+) symporter BenE family transporter [Mycolicibacterium sp. 018/SC-01/001]TRW80350.1 benzoate/H(+) symporter BenE family transporter [Mycolicibacterium sp. 018/SC-01/001]
MDQDVSKAVPVGAGVVCALVGFTSSFAVVLAGLRAAGADQAQAASGLMAVTLAMGAASVLLSWRFRMPITCAWSTPGAALLVSTGAAAGGWPAAVGAFAVTAMLLLATGLWPALARAVARIPHAVAQAMLAGVLLPLCIAPVTALAGDPVVIAPVLVVWLIVSVTRPRWAVPAAFGVALVVLAVTLVRDHAVPAASSWIPDLQATAPSFTVAALVGVALPLYIVTMAAQNIPGVAVMAGFGYHVPWRPALTVTAVASLLATPFGGHAVNLAAISAALAAGPDADPNPRRRWIAGVTTGAAYCALGLASTGLTAVVLAAPAGLVQAVAGVALLGAFANACAGAMADQATRLPAAVTLVVAASGATVAGVGAAFWALVTGVVVYKLVARNHVRRNEVSADSDD